LFVVSDQIAILLATGLVSLLSLSGIFALSLSEDTLHRILFFLVAFSAGTILGASIFDLLPEAIELVNEEVVFIYIAVGFVAFFILERFIYWYHGHGHHSDIEERVDERTATKGFAYLNIIGDSVHNFIDGMIIAASFTVGAHVGVATTIAVIFHELPQEMGDYGILIYAGFEKTRALVLNFAAALSVVAGGIFASFYLGNVEAFSGTLIAFSAGAFIYLAASELIPELKEEKDFWRSVIQFAVFILGLALIWYLGVLFHHE
jgi:zinc and cadmium transporter